MGSSPTAPTMITFKYNNKQYTTNNLENKLQKLGISKNEIEILGKKDLGEIDTSIKKYYFYNPKDKTTIVSIYEVLDKYIKNYDEYERMP